MELLDVTVTLEDGASGVYPLAAAAGLQAGYDHHIFLPLITDPYKEPPTRTPPAAPAGLKASLSEFSGFILKWTDRSSDETGFRIERRVSGVDSDYVELATVGRNTTEYFDSSSPIHYKKEYTYRVTAVGPAGNSKPAVVTFTAPAPPAVKPAAPADCWVEAITPHQPSSSGKTVRIMKNISTCGSSRKRISIWGGVPWPGLRPTPPS